MGQQTSKEVEREDARDEARLKEVHAALFEVLCLIEGHGKLFAQQAAEKAAGVPAAPGSAQALYTAAFEHSQQLGVEAIVISNRTTYRKMGIFKPMPAPTPPFNPAALPPLSAPAVAAAPASAPACSLEPKTPMGDANMQSGQRGCSSSSGKEADEEEGSKEEDGEEAGGVEHSAAVPLLGDDGNGRTELGLRRRQRHGI